MAVTTAVYSEEVPKLCREFKCWSFRQGVSFWIISLLETSKLNRSPKTQIKARFLWNGCWMFSMWKIFFCRVEALVTISVDKFSFLTCGGKFETETSLFLKGTKATWNWPAAWPCSFLTHRISALNKFMSNGKGKRRHWLKWKLFQLMSLHANLAFIEKKEKAKTQNNRGFPPKDD